MADDPGTVTLQKNLDSLAAELDKDLSAAQKEIEYAIKGLEKLGVKDPLKEYKGLLKDKDKNKKKLAECLAKAKQKIEAAMKGHELTLKMIEVPPSLPPDKLKELVKKIGERLKKKTISLSKYVDIRFDLDVDFKNPRKPKFKEGWVFVEIKW
jgi:hypothetical protein